MRNLRSFVIIGAYSKTCLKRPLKKKGPKIGFQDRISLNAGLEHSTMLSTFIKLPFFVKLFVLSILVAVLDRFYCNYNARFMCCRKNILMKAH